MSAFLGAFQINLDEISSIANSTTFSDSSDSLLLGFCRGSASAPRGFISAELGAETEPQCENTAAVVDTGRDAPLMGDQCESMPHV